jgi:hypothetical protein
MQSSREMAMQLFHVLLNLESYNPATLANGQKMTGKLQKLLNRVDLSVQVPVNLGPLI